MDCDPGSDHRAERRHRSEGVDEAQRGQETTTKLTRARDVGPGLGGLQSQRLHHPGRAGNAMSAEETEEFLGSMPGQEPSCDHPDAKQPKISRHATFFLLHFMPLTTMIAHEQ